MKERTSTLMALLVYHIVILSTIGLLLQSYGGHITVELGSETITVMVRMVGLIRVGCWVLAAKC